MNTASQAVQNKSSEEELTAVAKAVAAATAQLVSAARAKADTNSNAHKDLSAAAKAVATATSQVQFVQGPSHNGFSWWKQLVSRQKLIRKKRKKS